MRERKIIDDLLGYAAEVRQRFPGLLDRTNYGPLLSEWVEGALLRANAKPGQRWWQQVVYLQARGVVGAMQGFCRAMREGNVGPQEWRVLLESEDWTDSIVRERARGVLYDLTQEWISANDMLLRHWLQLPSLAFNPLLYLGDEGVINGWQASAYLHFLSEERAKGWTQEPFRMEIRTQGNSGAPFPDLDKNLGQRVRAQFDRSLWVLRVTVLDYDKRSWLEVMRAEKPA